MVRLNWKFLLLITGFLSLLACAPRVTTNPTAPQASRAPVETIASTRAPWQGEWERTLAMARKESTLVIYTSIGGDDRVELIKAFKEDFGIDVEWMVARTDAITQKERKFSGSAMVKIQAQG